MRNTSPTPAWLFQRYLKRLVPVPILCAAQSFAFMFSLVTMSPADQAKAALSIPKVLYSHTFDGSAAPIHNTVVDSGLLADGTVASNVWFAPNIVDGDDDNNRWMQNGKLQNGNYTSMLLPFSPENGFIYTLEANLTRPNTNGWVNAGFYNTDADDSSALSTGLGWALLKPETGGADAVAHYNSGGGVGNIGSSSALSSASATLTLILDTRKGTGNWTLTYALNGTEFAAMTNISQTAENSFAGIGIGMFGTTIDDGIRANSFRLTRSTPKKVFANSTVFTSYRVPSLADDEIGHYDRMLGWDTSLSTEETFNREVLEMANAGVDISLQELMYTTDTNSVIGRIQNIIDATIRMDTDLQVAISLIHGAFLDAPPSEAAYYFKSLKDAFSNNPRYLTHKGKMVFFLWNPFDDSTGVPTAGDRGPDDLQAVWDAMNFMDGVSRDDFYIVIDSGYLRRYWGDVYAVWDQDYIHDVMQTCDNLYYWFCFAEDEDKDRYNLLMESKSAEAPDEIHIAGLQPGYFRRNTGGTRVSYGTRYLRQMWENRVQNSTADYPADWVMWATWDDFQENHVLAPSVFNEGLYSALFYSMTAGWKGLQPSDPIELWMTTPSVFMKGEKVYAELVELNGCNPNRTLELEFRDFQKNKALKATSGTFSGPSKSYYNGLVNIYSMEFNTHSGFENVLALYPRLVINGSTVRLGPPTRVMDHHPIQPLYQAYKTDSWIWGLGTITNYSHVDGPGPRMVTFDLIDTTTVPIQSAEVRAINHRTIWSAYDPTNVNETISINTRDYNDAAGMVYGIFKDRNGHVHYTFPEVVTDTSTAVNAQSFNISAMDRWVATGGIYGIPGKLSEIGSWTLDQSAPLKFNFTGQPITNSSGNQVLFDYNANGKYAEVLNRSYWGYRLFLGFGPNERNYQDNPDFHPVYQSGTGYIFDGTNDIMRFKKDFLPAGTLKVRMVFTPNILKDSYLLYHKTAQCTIKLRSDGRIEFTRGQLSASGAEIKLTTSASYTTVKAGQQHTLLCIDNGDTLRVWIDGVWGPQQLDYVTEREFNLYRSFYSDLFLIGGTGTSGDSTYFDGSIRQVEIGAADL